LLHQFGGAAGLEISELAALALQAACLDEARLCWPRPPERAATGPVTVIL